MSPFSSSSSLMLLMLLLLLLQPLLLSPLTCVCVCVGWFTLTKRFLRLAVPLGTISGPMGRGKNTGYVEKRGVEN
ncbi:hypothetical protein BDF22DRAFT_681194, partial [Syncephalis plumigaleata]